MDFYGKRDDVPTDDEIADIRANINKQNETPYAGLSLGCVQCGHHIPLDDLLPGDHEFWRLECPECNKVHVLPNPQGIARAIEEEITQRFLDFLDAMSESLDD